MVLTVIENLGISRPYCSTKDEDVKINLGLTALKPTACIPYPYDWYNIQTKVKQRWQRHVALYNAFPIREFHLHETEMIFGQVIAEFEAMPGVALDDGRSSAVKFVSY